MSQSKKFVRLYASIADDRRMAKLSDLAFRVLILLQARAAEVSRFGCTEVHRDEVALEFRLRGIDPDSMSKAVDQLLSAQLITMRDGELSVSGWGDLRKASDSSSDRVARYRARAGGRAVAGKKSKGSSEGGQSVESAPVPASLIPAVDDDFSDFGELDVPHSDGDDEDFGADDFHVSAQAGGYTPDQRDVLSAFADEFPDSLAPVGYDESIASRIDALVSGHGVPTVKGYMNWLARNKDAVLGADSAVGVRVTDVLCVETMARALAAKSRERGASSRPSLRVVQ